MFFLSLRVVLRAAVAKIFLLTLSIRLLLFCIYLLNCVTFHENSGMGLFSYEDIGGGGACGMGVGSSTHFDSALIKHLEAKIVL